MERIHTVTSSADTRVLVLGASGMLGHTVFRLFAQSVGFDVAGSVRSAGLLRHLPEALRHRVVVGVDVENTESLAVLFGRVHPQVVINCIGLVKQVAEANDPRAAIAINALLPHRLATLCQVAGARFIHVSTDCVFAGTTGMYQEADAADAKDLYGLTKYLGEVDYPHAVTLRTSIIGQELDSAHGLLGWFLGQQGTVKGFTHAIFSGMPTVELARVMRDFVLPRPVLHGVYHVSAAPITKYDLLHLVAQAYGKAIQIVPDDYLRIDRSLDGTRFRSLTGYAPPSWPELVRAMCEFG